MENGDANLDTKFARLAVSDPINVNGNDGLFQVMKAVEAAEATIKQQVEENIRLRSELQKKDEELEKYKSGDLKSQNPQSADQWDGLVNEPRTGDQIIVGLGNQIGGIGNVDMNLGHDLVNSVLQKDLTRYDTDHSTHTQIEEFFDSNKVNRSLKVIPGGQVASDNSGFSQFVSPPITSFSPSRSALVGDSDSQLRGSGRGLIAMTEVNNPNSPKQDLDVKVREHEEEIMQLKRHLTEYSIKEAQISNEKYVLEKRISYMRMAFDQQQQDLVDAASRAISYRQDIMEENVRLTYALQAAQQERSTFVSSLMPLLAEYSLQPQVADAQSIVSNVKVLFRHLQEQLLITEGKLKDSQYQLAPWRSDVNSSNFVQPPFYPIEIKNGLELVAQPSYSNGMMPSSNHQETSDGDLLSRPQSGLHDVMKNSESNELRSYPPLASR
ncbi:hypothetical protein ACJIZ3_009870 [Penstemon smallii]|uniref:Uncharacterized protein n=1 Tax=Penstemon smallii TaxID=265156 RepID=A0ABD3TDQ2_9LAMI